MKTAFNKIFQSKSFPDADWLGIRLVTEKVNLRSVRDEHPLSNKVSLTQGIMAEALVDGMFGYASTNQLDEAGITRAVQSAVEQARAASKHKLFSFSQSQRPASRGNYQTTPSPQPMALSTINDLLHDSCKALKSSSQIVKALTYAQLSDIQINYYSSSGADFEQKIHLVDVFMEAIAADKSTNQKRSKGWCLQTGDAELANFHMIIEAKRIGEQALELLAAPDCPNENTNVILAPDQMMLQIHESIGHPLELDRILGDERNYAGWSFIKLEDFGKLKYGAPILNITFDPTVSNSYASYGFDDSGNQAKKEYIIKDGLLVSALGSLESQARADVKGVANYRACSWNRAPIDRMANLHMEAGDKNFDALLSQVENGIYMETNRSWSIDDYRNKFQFGCEYARRIKNGKLGEVLKNPNYRGITDSFWHNLSAVGDSSTVVNQGLSNCGKGEPNQVIKVSHRSPACAFRNIDVFGGVA